MSFSLKLLISNFITSILGFLIIGVIVYYGIASLSERFLQVTQLRAAKMSLNLQEIASSNTRTIREVYNNSFSTYGRKLISDDANNLKKILDHRSSDGVRNFLEKTLAEEKSLIMVELFVASGNKITDTEILSKKYPNGLKAPIVRGQDESWRGIDRKTNQEVKILDSDLEWVLSLHSFTMRLHDIPSQLPNKPNDTMKVYDFVLPIYNGSSDFNNIFEARKLGRPVTYIRYVFSLEAVDNKIKESDKNFLAFINQFDADNSVQFTALKAQTLQAISKLYLVLGGALIGILLLGWLLAWYLGNRLTKPIKELTQIAESMAKGNYRQEINVKSNDEIGVLADAFSNMSAAINKRDEELAHINRDLEILVEKRTVQLNESMKKVSSLLDNMKQAVFAVSADGKIVPPVSSYAQTVFKSEITGQNIFDAVFKSLDKNSEQYIALNSALNVVFGESELQWSLVEDSLPRLISFEQQTLKVAYNPLWNEKENLEQLMLVIEDVTDVLALEQKIALEKTANERNIHIIQVLAANETKELAKYFSSTYKLLSDTNEILKTFSISPERSGVLLRNLHTIKGNSRLYGFSYVAQLTHQLESELLSMIEAVRHNKSSLDSLKLAAQNAIIQIQMQVHEYGILAKKIFQVKDELESNDTYQISQVEADSAVSMIEVSSTKYKRMRENLQALSQNEKPLDNKIVLEFDNLLNPPIKPTFFKFQAMIQEISDRLGKKIQLQIKGDDASINREHLELLNDILTHMLRNSIDHGIESPSNRIEAGKSEVGTIALECSESQNGTVIRLTDDGKGIDANKLFEKAVATGLIDQRLASTYTQEQKLELIFCPGLTTKEEVTDLSGRGVGMDVVLSNIKKMGGSIQVRSKIGSGTEFLMSL